MTTPDAAPPPLRLVFWELTARCNLRCRHCRAEAGDGPAEDETPTAEILRIADGIGAALDPIVVLTGGEPLMHPDFFRIARHCADRICRVAIGTNGVLIDRVCARELRAAGVRRVGVSLDGASAATHDAFRGQPGSLDAALRGIAACRAEGLPVQINATVTRHNENELDDLLRLALEAGADAFHLFMLVPVGCGATLADEVRLPPERFEAILRRLYARSVELADRLHVKATCAPQYLRIARQDRDRPRSLPPLLDGATPPPAARPHGHAGGHPGGHPAGAGDAMKAVTRGCLAGSGVCFISRTGDVQPCGYLPIAVGNVRSTPLAEIWRAAPLFAALRDPANLRGKCGVCGYRRVCEGCRARAFAATGDVLGEEPECPYEPPASATAAAPDGGHRA